jgi:hypothetical protein
MLIPQAHGGQSGTGVSELLLVVTQLRDMVAAENSAVVAQEDHHRRGLVPQLAELVLVAVGVGKAEVGKSGGEGSV